MLQAASNIDRLHYRYMCCRFIYYTEWSVIHDTNGVKADFMDGNKMKIKNNKFALEDPFSRESSSTISEACVNFSDYQWDRDANNRQKVVLRRLKLKNKILACRASFWKKLNWRKIDISCQPKPSVLLQILRRNLLPRSTIFATLVANLHLLYEPFLSKEHTQCHNNLPNVPSVRIAKILQIKKKKRSMLWKIIKE